MYRIGITGNIGSGKTTACRVFEHLGISVFYSDIVAKSFYEKEEGKEMMRQFFGDSFFDLQQNIDKKKLSEHVFAHPSQMQRLNALIHPFVFDEFDQWQAVRQEAVYVLFESAILYSCGLENRFDGVIWVDTPEEESIRRVMKRNRFSEAEVRQRLKMQHVNASKSLSADFVIDNREEKLIIPQIIAIHDALSNKK
jgi:dephospho-CoA kinase